MWPGLDHPPHPPPVRRINNRSNEDWGREVSRSLAGEVSEFVTTRGGKMPMSITPSSTPAVVRCQTGLSKARNM